MNRHWIPELPSNPFTDFTSTFDYLSTFHLEIRTDAEKYELHALADEVTEFTKRHPDVMAKCRGMLKMEINSALQKWEQEHSDVQ